jgi:hypothetical protein
MNEHTYQTSPHPFILLALGIPSESGMCYSMIPNTIAYYHTWHRVLDTVTTLKWYPLSLVSTFLLAQTAFLFNGEFSEARNIVFLLFHVVTVALLTHCCNGEAAAAGNS